MSRQRRSLRPLLRWATTAADYDQGRPEYPAAVGALLRDVLAGARVTIDLGAGTGKLTRHLVDRDGTVVALDPVPEMLRRLPINAPGARPVLAWAEEIPVRSRSAEVLIASQSLHWFDDDAISELDRVASPEARLVLVWNLRVDPNPLTTILDLEGDPEVLVAELERRAPAITDRFGRARWSYVNHDHDLDRRALQSLLRSHGKPADAIDINEITVNDRVTIPYRTAVAVFERSQQG